MRRLPLIATLSLLAFPALADDAALLIGVERYDDLRRVTDATDILDTADSLRAAGYAVSTLANGAASDINRLLERFATDATDADRLVVGLSGQFVTDGTRSWFLAEDANRPSPFGLGDAVSLDMVMHVLARTPGQAVLILGYDPDADDTYGAYLRQGVGDLVIPQGVTVITGAPRFLNGLVNNAVTEPGENVMAFVRDRRRLQAQGFQPDTLIMQQDAIEDEAPTPRPIANPSLPAWTAAQEANTVEAYRSFIAEFPRSPYVAEARRSLEVVENDPVRLAELAEDALNLSRNERRAIQRDLTLLEFNTRGVDGIFGPGSRGAIRNWQQDNGFAQTSFLTRAQINRIDGQASRREAEIEAEEERAREEARSLDRDYWEETGARGNQAGYRAYLQRYPDGIFADEATSKLRVAPDNSEALARERALGINPVLRRLIENRLSQLGHNPGDIDGRFDNNTRRGIASYQRDSNLTATGYIDQPTLARLLADTFGR